VESAQSTGSKRRSRGAAAIYLATSALVAIASALELHGWHVYLGLALAGAGILIGVLRWRKKYPAS
jgi:hypothetical protein